MAITINISSQIVVQTAAQWAADAAVYTAKRILVTSDVFYGTGDQQKIKIADGTQTWTNLDYFPGADLATVGAIVLTGFAAGANTTVSATDTIAQALAKFQGQINVRATTSYVDGLVVGLLDDRGSYDASGNVYPSTGGSGAAGAIVKGDIWYISVAGTLGGVAVTVGDSVRALADTPGQTATNWSVLETNIGYVPQPLDQDLTDIAALSPSNDDFLQRKAGAWTNRTIAQVKTDLAIVAGLTIITKNADYNPAVAGDLVVYDTNAANRTVTLPAAPTNNDKIGVYLATKTSNFTVTIARNGKTIGGTAANVVLYIVQDYLELQYNSASNDWVVLKSDVSPHICKLSRNVAQAINATTQTKILHDTTLVDNASLADLVNSEIVIRRTGYYNAGFSHTWTVGADAQTYGYIYQNATDVEYVAVVNGVAGGARTLTVKSSGRLLLFNAGDSIQNDIYTETTGNTATGSLTKPVFWVEEVL